MRKNRFLPVGRVLAIVTTLVIDVGFRCEASVDEQQTTTSSSEEKEGDEEEAGPSGDTSAFVRVSFEPTYVLPTTDFVRGDNRAGEPIDWGAAIQAEVGWEVSGSEDWHHLYRFPSYGVGVSVAALGSEELGTPVDVYGFFDWPFASLSSRAELSTDLGFGVTFGWQPYDPETNPANRAIGSMTTFTIDWGLFLRYFLTHRIDVYAGVSFSHFSNGSLRAPNAGLNTLGPIVGIHYRLADRRAHPDRRPTPELGSRWGTAIWGAGGAKSIEVPTEVPERETIDTRQRFAIANVGATLLYRAHPMSTLRGGVDLTYDESANVGGSGADVDKRGLGLYGGYQQEIGKFAVLVDLGYYVWRGSEYSLSPGAYQRLGWNYRFLGNAYTGIQVRFIDFRRADFIEWTLGYRFDWPRRSGSKGVDRQEIH